MWRVVSNVAVLVKFLINLTLFLTKKLSTIKSQQTTLAATPTTLKNSFCFSCRCSAAV